MKKIWYNLIHYSLVLVCRYISEVRHGPADYAFDYLLALHYICTECEFSWVGRYVLPKVRAQKGRKNCCMFAALDAVAATMNILYHGAEWLLFAPQHFMDIMWPKGCLGKSHKEPYDFIRDFGILEEESHPYKAKAQNWKNPRGRKFFIRGHCKAAELSGDLDYTCLCTRPLSAIITVYKGFCDHRGTGIYELPEEPEKLGLHLVLVVGYGTHPITKKKFFLIKNSYGRKWGYFGYALICASLLYDFRYPQCIVKDRRNNAASTGTALNTTKMAEEYLAYEEALKELRKAIVKGRMKKKLKVEQLAGTIDEEPQSIQLYESGGAIPSLQTITKLERALGVQLCWMN